MGKLWDHKEKYGIIREKYGIIREKYGIIRRKPLRG
jgi:hypothetical protein